MVVSFTGTWVETKKTELYFGRSKSYPLRVRGLKHNFVLSDSAVTWSYPLRVRGLKHFCV